MPSLTEVRDAAVTLLQTVFPDLPVWKRSPGRSRSTPWRTSGFRRGYPYSSPPLPPTTKRLPDSLDFDVVASFGVLVISGNAAGAEYAEADALSVAETAALSIPRRDVRASRQPSPRQVS